MSYLDVVLPFSFSGPLRILSSDKKQHYIEAGSRCHSRFFLHVPPILVKKSIEQSPFQVMFVLHFGVIKILLFFLSLINL